MTYIDIEELCPSCYVPLEITLIEYQDFTFKVCPECTMRVLFKPVAKKKASSEICYVIDPDQSVPVFKYELLHPTTRMRVISQRWATLGRINAMNALLIDESRRVVKLSEIEDGLIEREASLEMFQWDVTASSEAAMAALSRLISPTGAALS